MRMRLGRGRGPNPDPRTCGFEMIDCSEWGMDCKMECNDSNEHPLPFFYKLSFH